MVNPENTFFSIKRFIGRKMNEVKDESKQVCSASNSPMLSACMHLQHYCTEHCVGMIPAAVFARWSCID